MALHLALELMIPIWNDLWFPLTLAVVPVMVLCMIFSRQLIRGLNSGAVK